MGSPIVHFEITGGGKGQLASFYSQLFGWGIDSNNPMQYGVVDTGAKQGINGGVFTNQDGSARVTVYAQVEDLQAALDKAEKLGGRTVLPPSAVPGGPSLALFTDPAGNLIGLMQAGTAR